MTDVINVGAANNDGMGDPLRDAFTKINIRFNELLGTIEGGDAWATGVTYTATPVRQWVINAGQAYVCAVNHVSGATFAGDFAGGKWFAVDSAQLRADLIAPSGSSIVGYAPAGTGAVATTVQSKLQESVSVFDYMTQAQIADVKAGTLTLDVTAAITAAIAASLGKCLVFPPFVYAVTSITFPIGQHTYDMRGAKIIGVASVPTDCIVKIESEGSTFYDLNVFANWNTNYKTCIWWYNSTASSQFNAVFGMRINYAIAGVYGLTYGEFPGNTSTLFAQSENQVYGFRTRGCQNPFYGNHGNGFLFFSDPIFVAGNEEAPVSPAFNWANASAITNELGYVVCAGGEIQRATSALGYTAKIAFTKFIGTVIETRGSLLITGTEVYFSDVKATMTGDSYPYFVMASYVSGATFTLNNSSFKRPNGIGAYDTQPFIRNDAPEAANTINIIDCELVEWGNSNASPFNPLIKSAFPNFVNTTYVSSVGVAPVILDTTRSNEQQLRGVDNYGYTANGWVLDIAYGGGTTLSVTSSAGPSGYLSRQLTLTATGEAYARAYDKTSAATLNTTALIVRPGDAYTCSILTKLTSGGNGRLVVDFYDAAGAFVSTTIIADSSSGIGVNWKKTVGSFVTPANAAYAGIYVFGNVSTVLFTDLKVYKN